MPKTSIPVAMWAIWHKFKRYYLLKTFSWFFIAVLKGAWNLEHFEYKVEYLSLIISEIIYSERAGYLNV